MAVDALITILIDGAATTPTVTVAVFVGSERDVAVSVTVPLFGAVAGAV